MEFKYSKQEVKYINAADKPTKERLKDAIHSLPLGDVKKLQGYQNDYRLRVGNIRVIFSIEDETIIIKCILPRGQVYKHI